MPAVSVDRSGIASTGGPGDSTRTLERHPLRKSLIGSLRSYFSSLVDLGRWRLAASIFLMVLASLTEGVGVALLFPILAVAGFNMAGEGHIGRYTAEAQRMLAGTGLARDLWLPVLLVLFLLLMALRSLFVRAQSVWTLGVVLRYEMALSRRLYQAITRAEWSFLASRRSSDLTHALTGEMMRVSTAAYQSMAALSSAILVLVYAVIAFKLSAATTGMVLVAGGFLLLAGRKWLRATHESGQALSETMSAVYSAATEHLQNLKTLKTYGVQSGDRASFTSLERSALDQDLRSTRSQAAAAFWFEAGSLMVLAAVVFVSLRIFYVGSASILLLLAIFTRLMPRLSACNSQLQGFLADLPGFENVMGLCEICEMHVEVASDRESAPALQRELRLDGVSFQYERDRPLVLDDISVRLGAGAITAIVGPSGAGKSTVADLVSGLLAPTRGFVSIDGSELVRAMASSWRSRIGYVAQDSVLFHDSVRRNLLWSRPEATVGDISNALKLAAAEFVFDLPQGLDTVVGDRGALLSNGQRQRLALARALLRKPSLLILDEATSSLDLENEKRILNAIERLKGQTTVLLIAHRASAVEHADLVYVLDHGRITGLGTWSELRGSSPAAIFAP